MKKISVVTPCFNEEKNVREIYEQVKGVFSLLGNYSYEHIFIDNASTDATLPILRLLAQEDKRVKVIVNARNFGHLRSPFYGMLQAHGDAVISLVADLQDPPAMIHNFLEKWEEGFRIVVGVKASTQETFPMSFIRTSYYRLVTQIADVKLIKNFTGFGLYDQRIIEILRGIDDAYPYFRGLICEIGFPVAELPYEQPLRRRGISKNNFYTLYDAAMLGITSHSKLPIRLATMAGFFLSSLSLLVAVIFLIAKLVFWNHFALGVAPTLIGMFSFASVQLFFTGLLGEYVLSIHTQVLKRPLVVESERINFDD